MTEMLTRDADKLHRTPRAGRSASTAHTAGRLCRA